MGRKPLGAQPAIGGHLPHLGRLTREHAIEQAGPFHQPHKRVTGTLVGLVVFRVESVDQARERVERDPAVRSGTLAVELLPWLV